MYHYNMKSGKLALLDSDEMELTESYAEHDLPDKSPFDNVSATITVEETFKLGQGRECYVGTAAEEVVESEDTNEILGPGDISEESTPVKRTLTTNFLLLPDEFIIVENSSGEFLHPLLREFGNHTAFPAEIDLDGFLNEVDGDFWKVGFEERADGAENGVLHGESVLSDSTFGDVVGKSPKNQVGIDFEYGQEFIKLFVTSSGYVEVYQPSSFETDQFATFVADRVLSNSRMA